MRYQSEINGNDLAIVGGLALLVYFFLPKIASGATKTLIDTTAAVGNEIVAGVGNAVSYPVDVVTTGIPAAIGAPLTNAQMCAAARATGSSWDVSRYCSASEWWDYINTPDTMTYYPATPWVNGQPAQ